MLPTQGEYEAIKDAYDVMLGANAAAIAGQRERERVRRDAEQRKDQAHKRELEVLASKFTLLSSKVQLLEEQKKDLQEFVQAKELVIGREQALNKEQRRVLGEERKAHEDMLSELQIKQGFELVATQRRQEGETGFPGVGLTRADFVLHLQFSTLISPLTPPFCPSFDCCPPMALSCGDAAAERRSWASATSLAPSESAE